MADESDFEELPPTLQNLLDQKELEWIFVGGKGGVGKTTTSCSLAVAMSKVRESVLLLSTDPAHNLSDAFNQKFTKSPTQVNGFDNLFAMEIDPTMEHETDDVLDDSSKSMMQELTSSLPGVDEAVSFAELMKQVQNMDYSVIIFDTAPTGHTLRLLRFPTVLGNAMEKFMEIKGRFSGIISQFSGLLGGGGNPEDMILGKLESMQTITANVNKQFQDPDKTTFVCVCIPEFLSLFETERLVQELTKYDIDTHNIVVNQVLVPDPEGDCKKCRARSKMQNKYLEQIDDLYDDFHVVKMPLLDEEVRGKEHLNIFSELLIYNGSPYDKEKHAANSLASSSSSSS